MGDFGSRLSQFRDAGVERLEVGLLAVARRIVECLGCSMRKSISGGVSWVCREPALTRFGVACSECVVVVGQMVLEAHYWPKD